MYEPSKQIEQFEIKSFMYHDGCLVLDQLRPGMKLDIEPEFDNPYDPNALALYYDEQRVGYIPREHNWVPSQLVRFGHADALEVRILQVAPEKHPSSQVRAALYVVDAREK